MAFAGFLLLGAAAAHVYPGGTRKDPARPGFSLVHNFWCDLTGAKTWAGQPNPSRAWAVAAMVVLCAGVALFFWLAPALFPGAPRRGRLVRLGGLGLAVATPFVATTAHDAAIFTAGAFGVAAFLATATALPRDRFRRLFLLEAATLFLTCVNFVIWQSGVGLWALPLLQKVAFLFVASWVAVLTLRLWRTSR